MNHLPFPPRRLGKKSPLQIAGILMFLLSIVLTGTSAQADWQETGVRLGIQGGARHQYFHQYDAYAVYGLPWEWRTSSGWGVGTLATISAGALHSNGETGFIGSFGPGLVFDKRGKGIALEVGINADLLDRRQFGDIDFGSILMLGAYMGVAYRFDNGLGIGYRLQHLSNGHVFYPNGTPNPGLDEHLIGLSWNF